MVLPAILYSSVSTVRQRQSGTGLYHDSEDDAMTGESDRDKMILKLSHREVHSGQHMDEDEKRETLIDAGLDPDDYEVYPSYTRPIRITALQIQ